MNHQQEKITIFLKANHFHVQNLLLEKQIKAQVSNIYSDKGQVLSVNLIISAS